MAEIIQDLKLQSDPSTIVRPNIVTSNVPDEGITTPKIADGGITTPKIADGAITGSKIGNGEVDTANVKSNAITTGKIASGAVTSGKLANGAVTYDKIGDGEIANVKIANKGVSCNNLNVFGMGITLDQYLSALSITDFAGFYSLISSMLTDKTSYFGLRFEIATSHIPVFFWLSSGKVIYFNLSQMIETQIANDSDFNNVLLSLAPNINISFIAR